MAKPKSVWKQIGEFSVDSGTVMLVDPCYLEDGGHAEIVRDFAALRQARIGAHDCSPIAQQCGRLTVVSSTGCSDGGYPIYAQIEDGYVKALFIRFMDE